MVITITATTSFAMNFHQVAMLIRPRARAPITIPEAGAIKLKTPHAAWQAVIITLGRTLTNSPNGAMIPIVALARPDEDGIKNDIGK